LERFLARATKTMIELSQLTAADLGRSVERRIYFYGVRTRWQLGSVWAVYTECYPAGRSNLGVKEPVHNLCQYGAYQLTSQMKLLDISYAQECYVYSTSYRFCFSHLAFAPSTTIGPLDGDMSKAVNITWHRKDRRLLPELHKQILESAETYGLKEFEVCAKLAFTHPEGPRKGLETIAATPKGMGDNDFPLPPSVIPAIRLFVPTKWPSPKEMTVGRNIWSKRAEQLRRRGAQ
jgi:hypothetical protein